MQTDTDPFGEQDDFPIDLNDPVILKARRDSLRVDVEQIKQDEDRKRRQPPSTFHAEKLPMEWVWRFVHVPEHLRWRRVPGDSVRTLLPSVIVRDWDSLLNSSSSLLIAGPTGSGKDALARLIHRLGPRKARRFVKIGAGAATPQLVVSRLHGYQKGSHTTAQESAPGQLVEADGGTLVVDDIDLNPMLQESLLTFMDDYMARPEGSHDVQQHVDVRLIGTINKDPHDERHLRHDLFHRFEKLVQLPPLQRRDPADVAMLLQEYLRSSQRLRSVKLRLLLRAMWHPWPGNVRELMRYCRDVITSTAEDAQSAEMLNDGTSPRTELPPLHADAIENRRPNEPQSVAERLVMANLTQETAHRIEQGDMETANSLLLLVHLASSPQFERCATMHTPLVPLARLDKPDSFPKCYRLLSDEGWTSTSVGLVHFLAHVVDISRRAQGANTGRLLDVGSVEGWMGWLSNYPRSLLPDHMNMVDDGSFSHTSSSRSSTSMCSESGPASESKGETTQGRAMKSRASSRGGRPATLTDEKLVELLQWAEDENQARRFTEARFWRRIAEEAGRDAYRDQKTLSQRVRRIRDFELRERARNLVRFLFGSIS